MYKHFIHYTHTYRPTNTHTSPLSILLFNNFISLRLFLCSKSDWPGVHVQDGSLFSWRGSTVTGGKGGQSLTRRLLFQEAELMFSPAPLFLWFKVIPPNRTIIVIRGVGRCRPFPLLRLRPASHVFPAFLSTTGTLRFTDHGAVDGL